jgi:hypothetical protein
MNKFARYVSFAVVVGMVNLTMAEALAQSAGTAGAAGTGGNGSGSASGGNGNGSTSGGDGGFGAPNGHGAGYFTPGAASGACGIELRLPNPATSADALQSVEEITQQTQTYLEQCGCATQACVADALDKYADALQKIAPQLPRALRVLPKIIHQAAQKARVAPTVRVAVKVLQATVVVVQRIVRKTIELMRAKDPDAANVATRGGDLVASTLNTAATVLERAESL